MKRISPVILHRIKQLLFVFAMGLAVYLLFYNLGKAPFENWDEAWYAEAVKQMLRTKDVIVLYWDQTVWLDKPPMYIWFSALFSGIFGLSEFSVRLTSAISGLVAILLVTYYSYKWYGLLPAALGFITLALNNVFIWRARTGNLDALTALLVLLVYFVMLSKHKHRYLMLGLLFASIYFARASLVLFPVLVFVVFELVFRIKDLRKNLLSYLKLTLIFLGLPALWLLFGYLGAGGADFVNFYLFKSDHDVARIDLNHLNPSYLSFTYYALQRRFFWLLVIGAVFALLAWKKQKELLALFFAGCLFAMLSVAPKSNNWYLVPVMPFWSLLIAFGTYRILQLFKNKLLHTIIVGGLLAVSLYISYRTLTINIMPILDVSQANKQAEASIMLRKLSKPDEVVVRLDHLYPTTIYYTDRKVLSSPQGTGKASGVFIGREDLKKALLIGKIKWVIGLEKDMIQLQSEAPEVTFAIKKVNDEEVIGEVKKPAF